METLTETPHEHEWVVTCDGTVHTEWCDTCQTSGNTWPCPEAGTWPTECE